MGAARQGSITQWVLRSDYCTCKLNLPDLQETQTRNEEDDAPVFEEAELELDGAHFPIDRYKPLKEIGQGGSGTVYLSRDRLLGKRVAIKVLRLREREALVSFQNEAKTTSKLNHPNIVKVFDFGVTDGGTPFMVMEQVNGQSLEAILAETGGLDVARAVPLMLQFADALAYAHDNGILHRDLKPSNILIVEKDGRQEAKLIDFGVAKMRALSDDTLKINNTSLVGTPAYMSPDQARGLAYNERSELYSVGCVIYETLAGRPPFIADSPLEVIAMHAREPIPQLDIPTTGDSSNVEVLNSIIARCMDKDPSQRFQNAQALKENLAAVSVLPQTETKASVSRTTTGGGKQNLILIVAIVVAILAIPSAQMLFRDIALPVKDENSKEQKKTKKKKSANSAEQSFIVEGKFRITENRACWEARGLLDDDDLEWLAANRSDEIERLVLGNGNTGMSQDLFTERGYLAISKLRKLKLLALTNVAVPFTKRAIRALASIPALREIYFSKTKLTDEHLKLFRPPHLKLLYLTSTPVTDAGAASIADLKELEHLSLTDTKVTDKTLSTLNAKQFKEVCLDDCKLTEDGLKQLKNWTSLEKLSLKGLKVSAELVKSLSALDLKEFSTVMCSKYDDECLLLTVKQWPNMRGLYISGTPVTPSAMKKTAALKQLETAEWNDLALQDKDLDFVTEMPALQALFIEFNHVTDAFLKRVASRSRIRMISLYGCSQITQKGLDQLRAKGIVYQAHEQANMKGIDDFMDTMLK